MDAFGKEMGVGAIMALGWTGLQVVEGRETCCISLLAVIVIRGYKMFCGEWGRSGVAPLHLHFTVPKIKPLVELILEHRKDSQNLFCC